MHLLLVFVSPLIVLYWLLNYTETLETCLHFVTFYASGNFNQMITVLKNIHSSVLSIKDVFIELVKSCYPTIVHFCPH